MGFLKGFVISLLVFFVGRKIYSTIVFLKLGNTVFEHTPGPCHVIKGANQGSEDTALLPDGQVLITSGLRFLTHGLKTHRGKILLFDFKKPDQVEELDIIWKNEARFFDDFNPHGIDVFTTKQGKTIVFVVNHDPHEAIERFELNLKKKTLTHLESIKDANMHLMNSVVALDERTFFFTNYMYTRGGLITKLEMFLDLRYGSLAGYDGKTSKSKILKQGYGQANGLALSRDRRKLYLANIKDQAIDTFDVRSIFDITLAESDVINTIPDNIQVDPVDGSLWIGCHPTPWLALLYLENPDDTPGSPSQVINVKVDKQGMPLVDSVTEAYTNKGSELAGSAVALHYQNKLLIGSVCHNAVVCEIRNR